jgi:hypothetical protein
MTLLLHAGPGFMQSQEQSTCVCLTLFTICIGNLISFFSVLAWLSNFKLALYCKCLGQATAECCQGLNYLYILERAALS